MEKYDIFKSEGGYRLCLGVWGGNPIVSACPWYETFEQAEKAKEEHIIQNKAYDLTEHDITFLSPEFLGGYVKGTDQERYVKHMFHLARKKKNSESELEKMKKYITEHDKENY